MQCVDLHLNQFPILQGIGSTCHNRFPIFTFGCFAGGIQRAGDNCTHCWFFDCTGLAFNCAGLQQKMDNNLLYLVYRGQIDPAHIAVGDLVDVFIYLYEIHTYKTAMLSALALRERITLVQLLLLNKLLNTFHLRSPKPSPLRDWDIGLVAKVFSLPPFEPIQQASVAGTCVYRVHHIYAHPFFYMHSETGVKVCESMCKVLINRHIFRTFFKTPASWHA